jgi:CHASE3 domain sensor protein
MNANATFKRNLIVSTSVSVLILIVSSTASFLSIKSLLDSNSLVSHTHEVIYNLNAAKLTMADAQTSVRGYLITGRENFLERYIGGEANTDAFIEKLEVMTADNAPQQLTLRKLKPVIYSYFRYLDRRVKDKRENRQTMATDLERESNSPMRFVYS